MMFIRQSTHDREIAKLERRIADLVATNAKVFGANLRMARENAELRRELQIFRGPRQRDARGHFLPVRRVSA